MKKLILVVVVLVLVAVGALFVLFDPAVKRLVEEQGTSALGVETTLSTVAVHPIAGEVTLGGLEVQNPPGFPSKDLLQVESGRLQVEVRSLLSDQVHAQLLELGGIQMAIERNLQGTNYGTVLDHLEQETGAGGGAGGSKGAKKKAGSAKSGSQKEFVIDRVVIRGAKVHLSVGVAGATPVKTTIDLPDIQLENVGSADQGKTIAQLLEIVLKELLRAAATNGGDVIPADLLQDLESQVKGLGSLGESAVGQAEQAVGEAAGKLEGSLKKKLGGVLGGKQEAKPKSGGN